MTPSRLRMGMVGGGRDAFIGAVHRAAACMDHGARFIAGCLSSSPERALASGMELGLEDHRNYPTWRDMLRAELNLPREQRIDFVSIVTPNDTHFEIADAFAASGFHVVCDKPLCHTSIQAARLIETVRNSGVVFAVTYNYSGYPLVKQARDMIAKGEIGEIRKVVVEYNQGWLAGALEKSGQKQAEWRTDPSRSGAGGAIGDIGSHAEHLARYITGLEIDSICADLTTFVEGRRLDDDANLLLRFAPAAGAKSGTPPARGVLIASQVEIGHENDLRIRVHGTTGSIEWRQESPNELIHRPIGQPDRVLRRGNPYLCEAAKQATRLPAGHPEAFLEAFANIYRSAFAAMRAPNPCITACDHPTVQDGAKGVWFIEKTVESARSDRKWTSAKFPGNK